MKHRYIFIFFLTAFLFQSVFVLGFGIRGQSPHFLLCVTILLSFYFEERAVLIYALIFGFILDVHFSLLSGPTAGLLVLIAVIMSWLKQFFYRESIINLLMISTLSTLVFYSLHWVIIRIFKGIYSFMYMARTLPTILAMNLFVMIILYFAVVKRTKKKSEYKLI